MQLSKDVDQFTSICESLIFDATRAGGRELKEDEARLVEYYCHEILHKLIESRRAKS